MPETPNPLVVRTRLVLAIAATVAALVAGMGACPGQSRRGVARAAAAGGPHDPAAWGEDHVGQPMPEFMTGGECLFCHRAIGATWHANRHHRTMREPEPGAPPEPMLAALEKNPASKDFAKDVQLFLGSGSHGRFLKLGPGYGQVQLLSADWTAGADGQPGQLTLKEPLAWDAEKFGSRCVGCHASAVDSNEKTFGAAGHDCFVCHGEVVPEHAKDTSLVVLNKKKTESARVQVSICASCHVRTGKSRSTGLPFPNNFVPGDNVFRDLAIDWSDAALASLDPGDRHVLENVKAVVVNGDESLTCRSCHDVHGQSTSRHRRLAESKACATCHEPGKPKNEPAAYVNHAKACEY